jgi:hypothetical protein
MSTTLKTSDHEIWIYNRLYRVCDLATIWPDDWVGASTILKSAWEKAEFYLLSFRYGPGHVVAVNVKITGRTLQRRPHSSEDWIRVQIEFVKDGDEPSEFCGGWMKAEPKEYC